MIEFILPSVHHPCPRIPFSAYPSSLCTTLFKGAIDLIWGPQSADPALSIDKHVANQISQKEPQPSVLVAASTVLQTEEPEKTPLPDLVPMDIPQGPAMLAPDIATPMDTVDVRPQDATRLPTNNKPAPGLSKNKRRKASRKRRTLQSAGQPNPKRQRTARLALSTFSAGKQKCRVSKKSELKFAQDISMVPLPNAAASHMADRLEVTRILLEGLANAAADRSLPGASNDYIVVGSNGNFRTGMYSSQGYYGPDSKPSFQRAHCSFLSKILLEKSEENGTQALILEGDIVSDGRRYNLTELLNVVHLADERINLADNLIENLVREPLLAIIERVRQGKLGGSEAFAEFKSKVEDTLRALTDIRSQFSLHHELAAQRQRTKNMSLKAKNFQYASHDSLSSSDKQQILMSMLRTVNPNTPDIVLGKGKENRGRRKQNNKNVISFSLTGGGFRG